MNRTFFISIIILLSGCTPKIYDDFFTEKRFRFDYVIEGNAESQEIEGLSVWEEDIWGGSKENLVDTFFYGDYYLNIFDEKQDKLIYSRGFSDLFIEWQTTAEAKVSDRAYKQSILFPALKRTGRIEILKRDSTMNFNLIYSATVHPKTVKAWKGVDDNIVTRTIHEGDKPEKALDITFLAEGYTVEQQDKFFKDVERFKGYLFSWEPYNQYKESVNFHAVFAPSAEKGVDIPGKDQYVNTIVDAHFYTFDIERYLTLPDLTKVYNYLGATPVDQVVILVNSDKYGGGGIYNFYSIFTSDNAFAERLFLHEFGHGFASLGDEYFNSEVAYENFGSTNYEPYEPNITNLINFEAKWKGMIADSVPVPTPDSSVYDNVIGVFEGANYVSKGFYRPYRNCAMRSSGMKYFCPVCKRSIEEMLLFYAK